MTGMFERAPKPEFSSIPWIVEALQQIHDRKRPDSGAQDASPRGAIEADGAVGLIDLMLGGIASEIRDLGRKLSSPPERDVDITAEGQRSYQALREELDRVETKARRHAGLVERSIGRTAPARSAVGASFYQETLYLRCRRLGRSSGRFRCENLRGRRTEVQALSQRFVAGPTDFPDQPQMIVRPDNFVLDVSESRVVVVEIDLSACVGVAIGTLEASIDLLMDDAVALKLWIEVDVYDLP